MPASLGLPPGPLNGVWSDETYAWVKKYVRMARDPHGGFFGLDQGIALAESFGLFHAKNTQNPYRSGNTVWQWRDPTPYLPSPGSIQRLVRDISKWGAEGNQYTNQPNLDQGQTLVSFLEELHTSNWQNSMKFTAEALLNITDWGSEWNEQVFDLDIYEPADRDGIAALFANPTMPQWLRQAAIDSHAYQTKDSMMGRLRDWKKNYDGFGDWAQAAAMAGLLRNPSTTHEEVKELVFLIEDATDKTKEAFATERPVTNYFSSMRDMLLNAKARLGTSPLKGGHGYGIDCPGTCLCNTDWKVGLREDWGTKEEAFNKRFEFATYLYRKVNGAGFDEALSFNAFYCPNYDEAYSIRASATEKMVEYFTETPWIPSPSSFPWTTLPALTYHGRLLEVQESLGDTEIPLEWSSLLMA